MDYLIQSETLSAIGDAIRAKTGKSEMITPENMAAEISAISGGGSGEQKLIELLTFDEEGFPLEVLVNGTESYTLPTSFFRCVNSSNGMFINTKKITLLSTSNISASAFRECANLIAVIIKSNNICRLASTNAFIGTLIETGTGFVYVSKALVEEYKSASNWTVYANQIRAIEDYPEITGGAA